jgi:hypothetical protein
MPDNSGLTVPPFIAALDVAGAPTSGTRLPVDRASRWWPGTYLLYQRGIEYFRPTEAPEWLAEAVNASGVRVGGLPTYLDEATEELVPVLGVGMDSPGSVPLGG